MKVQIGILAALLTLGLACSNASDFEGAQAVKKMAKNSDDAAAEKDNTPAGPAAPAEPAAPETPAAPVEPVQVPVAEPEDPAVEPVVPVTAITDPITDTLAEAEQTISVILPGDTLRAGRIQLQAKAVLGLPNRGDKVIWKVEGPGADFGVIDENGVYTSPNRVLKETLVTITGSIENDPSLSSSKPLKIIPVDQLFVGCLVGDEVFPITAQVYTLPKGQVGLPQFDAIESSKKTTVCLDKYDVPARNFTEGFPGIPGLFEWFALKSNTHLIIEQEGDYRFSLLSDDGANLYINGDKIIDNDGQHGPRERTGVVNLKPGVHKFEIHWYQGPAQEIALQLKWQKPNTMNMVVVPTAAFSAVE